MQQPLRYEISKWDQISKCQSNNSREIHLRYVQVMDKSLSGDLIRVEHDRFGCLFAYLVHGSGKILSPAKDGLYHEWTSEEVLKELEKYGFLIQFADHYDITSSQIKLLMTIQDLGMDKIRFLTVIPKYTGNRGRVEPPQTKLVAFKIDNNPRWLDNRYLISEEDFGKSIVEGWAINLTEMNGGPKKENWQFLYDRILDVDSILKAIGTEVIDAE